VASLYLLIPVSLIFCALAISIFFWAVNNGQYDDLDAEGERLLFGDDDLEQDQCTRGDRGAVEETEPAVGDKPTGGEVSMPKEPAAENSNKMDL
jgi:cbb3-type cytochrome oxidase maturation protein